MKTVLFGLCAVAILSLFGRFADRMESGFTRAKAQTGTIPVVVELFTSEGCSSCPPADALLERLDEKQPLEQIEVIAIEEHVDYWDGLGWRDPFSSHDWTERQYAYATELGNRNAYTPQMVVDGDREFVGSQTSRAREAILESANQPRILVTLAQKKSEKYETSAFAIEAGKPAPGVRAKKMEVWLAITEAGLYSSVKAGENQGNELHHAPVLRRLKKVGQFETISEKPFSGLFEIGLRKEWKKEQLRAVAFVQDKSTGRILGAAQVHLNP
jgi:hypothetical protein